MSKLSKKKIKELTEKLARQTPTVWEKASAAERKTIMTLAERYKKFLDQAKTERLAVETIQARAVKQGFKPIEGKAKGKKFYAVYHGKAIALGVLGRNKPGRGCASWGRT